MESAGFFFVGFWLDRHFRATGTFGTDGDHVSVWELIGLPCLVHLKIHRDGENAVSSLQMSASHFVTCWAECAVESVGSFTREICVEQYLDAIETFSADSGDVSLLEHEGLFVILVLCRNLATHCTVSQ